MADTPAPEGVQFTAEEDAVVERVFGFPLFTKLVTFLRDTIIDCAKFTERVKKIMDEHVSETITKTVDDRLAGIQTKLAAIDTLDAKATGAVNEAAGKRFADKKFAEEVVKAMIGNPTGMGLLMDSIISNPRAIKALSIAVNESKREFFDRVNTIREILGISPDDHSADRAINACANLHLENGESLDHMDEFVVREQASGNLPPTVAPPQSIPPTPVSGNILPANAEIITERLKALVKPEVFGQQEKELRSIARAFATRKQDENRTLPQLLEIVRSKCGDIFITV